MRIAAIETIRCGSQPNVLFVRVHADDSSIGLGETYYLPGVVEAVVHDLLAGFVLGQSVFDRELHWNSIFSRINNFGYAGAEMRALSAMDIALWDLIGQTTGQPIYNLIGGRCRDRILVYNTCVNGGPHQDQTGFLERPAELAQSLLAQGITAMKIWPWDRFAPQAAVASSVGPAGRAVLGLTGSYISPQHVNGGLDSVRRIRESSGGKMEIIIEGRGRWDLNCAVRIGRALEPYDILWMEDMIKPDNSPDIAKLRSSVRVPLCVSERLFTRYAYRQVLEQQAADVIMTDVVWTGGITEGHKIAILADSHHLPVTPHDCTGLVTLFANLHLCAAAPNAMILETVRGFYEGWYREVYTENICIREGFAEFPTKPGLGTALRDEFLKGADVTTRISRA